MLHNESWFLQRQRHSNSPLIRMAADTCLFGTAIFQTIRWILKSREKSTGVLSREVSSHVSKPELRRLECRLILYHPLTVTRTLFNIPRGCHGGSAVTTISATAIGMRVGGSSLVTCPSTDVEKLIGYTHCVFNGMDVVAPFMTGKN